MSDHHECRPGQPYGLITRNIGGRNPDGTHTTHPWELILDAERIDIRHCPFCGEKLSDAEVAR